MLRRMRQSLQTVYTTTQDYTMRPSLMQVAVAAALAFGMQASAFAATNIGLVSDSTSYGSSTAGTSFTDLYNFTVEPNAGAGFSASYTLFKNLGASVSTLALYMGTYATSVDLDASKKISLINLDRSSSTSGRFTSTLLTAESATLSPAATYTLVVSGGGTGSYSGSVMLSPVPEPETYAMMLAGLGVMGFIARRRRKNG